MKETDITKVTSVLCLLFFAASLVVWNETMHDLDNHFELCREAVKHTDIWYNDILYSVHYMWVHSNLFRVMVTLEIISAICCFPGAILMSIAMVPMSILLLLASNYNVVTVSLSSWLFLAGADIVVGIIVFILYAIFEKKEVSLQQ